MLEPISKTIEVPCTQEQAFKIFIEEMGSWWPLDKFSTSAKSGKTAKGLRVEARLGGKIVEIGHDDTEHLWGTITSYCPYDSFSMDFHIAEPATSASLVEVRFTALSSERTQVVLTQSNWEAFAKKAPWMREGYGIGWRIIFDQAYKSACGG